MDGMDGREGDPVVGARVARLAGFTLVETMVALAVLAILLTIGMPQFSGTLSRTRAQAALNLLGTDIAMARSSAVMRGGDVVVCPGGWPAGCRTDQDWSSGWMVFIDSDRDREPGSDADVIRVGTLPGRNDHMQMRSNRPAIRYQPDGRSANSNLTVNLCDRDLLAGQLIVNNVGRLRTSYTSAGRPCPAP